MDNEQGKVMVSGIRAPDRLENEVLPLILLTFIKFNLKASNSQIKAGNKLSEMGKSSYFETGFS